MSGTQALATASVAMLSKKDRASFFSCSMPLTPAKGEMGSK